MRAAVLVLALGLGGCGFEHGALNGGGSGSSAGDDGGPDIDTPPVSWWNTAWGYRMPITIVNSSAQALPMGYQVGFAYPFYSAPCNGQRDDVRFVYGDTTELNRAFDDVTPPFAWFPLAAPLAAGATSKGEYFLYCGNSAPGSGPSNPKTLFDFYDAFGQSGGVDTSVWTIKNGATLSNGKLVCGNSGQGDNGVVTTTPAFTANHAVDFIAIASSTSNNSWWAGFQIGTPDVPPWLHWWTEQQTTIRPDFKATDTSTLWLGTEKNLDTQPHYYSIENYGMKSMYRYDDAVYETHVYDVAPPATLSVRLWNGQSTPAVSYDMVRVRKAVDPPPTVTVGAPEPRPL
jgi:hypothetical protein